MNNLTDRIVSALAYLSFGVFSLIWIVYVNIVKKHMKPFLTFNLYQAIFVSVVLTIFSYLYEIALNLLKTIPYIGKIADKFDIIINHNPIYFGFTITGLIITCLVAYLVFLSLLGEKPKLPLVSEIIESNFGG